MAFDMHPRPEDRENFARPSTVMNIPKKFSLTARLLALITGLAVGLPLNGPAQSDNFDSYSSAAQLSAAGWILSSLNPALVSTTFPAVGSGNGLRVQANPVPGQAPA